MYTFASTHNGSSISVAGDIPTVRPYHRHVRIVKPGPNSHHREGWVYVQVALEGTPPPQEFPL